MKVSFANHRREWEIDALTSLARKNCAAAWSTCRHEAAHAIVALHADLGLKRVRVDQEENKIVSGECVVSPPPPASKASLAWSIAGLIVNKPAWTADPTQLERYQADFKDACFITAKLAKLDRKAFLKLNTIHDLFPIREFASVWNWTAKYLAWDRVCLDALAYAIFIEKELDAERVQEISDLFRRANGWMLTAWQMQQDEQQWAWAQEASEARTATTVAPTSFYDDDDDW